MDGVSSNEKDIAVQAVQIQVLIRDLERHRQDFKDYKDEREREDERRDKDIRSLQDAQRWVLGAMAVVGSILTLGGSAILKFFAGLIARSA